MTPRTMPPPTHIDGLHKLNLWMSAEQVGTGSNRIGGCRIGAADSECHQACHANRVQNFSHQIFLYLFTALFVR
jgi:hypothetical protein